MIPTSFFLVFFGLTACQEVDSKETIDSTTTTHSTENPKRQHVLQNLDSTASCLEVCGFEARGTVYADCINDGEDRQECGVSARSWYRECLETRCGEAAIEFDNCRTSCRIDQKEEKYNCNFVEDKQDCLEGVRSTIRSCIDTCQ